MQTIKKTVLRLIVVFASSATAQVHKDCGFLKLESISPRLKFKKVAVQWTEEDAVCEYTWEHGDFKDNTDDLKQAFEEFKSVCESFNEMPAIMGDVEWEFLIFETVYTNATVIEPHMYYSVCTALIEKEKGRIQYDVVGPAGYHQFLRLR